MNAGKLVAQLAALAIIVYCSYSAVISAIPLDKEDMTHPLEGLDGMAVNTSMSGVNLNVSIDGDITSNLPQDIVGVKVAFYIGKDTTMITLLEKDIGTIQSKVPYHLTANASIPMCTILSYAVCAIDDLGHMKVPIRTQVEFKYFEWQDSYLVDLGITVNMNYETDLPMAPPTPVFDPADNSVTMEMDIVSTGSDLISAIASHIADDTYEFSCNGATFTAVKSGTDITLEAAGTSEYTAVQLLQEYLDNNGNLTVTYGSEDYVIDKDNAESFINILKVFYDKAVTP